MRLCSWGASPNFMIHRPAGTAASTLPRRKRFHRHVHSSYGRQHAAQLCCRSPNYPPRRIAFSQHLFTKIQRLAHLNTFQSPYQHTRILTLSLSIQPKSPKPSVSQQLLAHYHTSSTVPTPKICLYIKEKRPKGRSLKHRFARSKGTSVC